MPKKDKDKKLGHAAKKPEAVDPLPQVWLPDQVSIIDCTYMLIAVAS